MYEFTGSVGVGRQNHSHDVAFVQFALKHIPEKRSSKGGLFAKDISGKYSEELQEAIDIYVEEKGIRPAGFSTANGKTYSISSDAGIIKDLPSMYKPLVLSIFSIGGAVVGLFTESKARARPKYRVKDLALPNAAAQQLLGILSQLAARFKVVANVEDINVSHDGKFLVRVSTSGGLVLDKHTGKTKQATSKGLREILANIAEKPSSTVKIDLSDWELSSNKELLFRTKKAYEILALSAGKKASRRYALGNHKIREQKNAVERVLTAYDIARTSDQLDVARKQQLIEFFGEAWESIEQQDRVRKQACLFYARQHAQILSNIQRLKKGLDSIPVRLNQLNASNDAFISKTAVALAGIISGLGLTKMAHKSKTLSMIGSGKPAGSKTKTAREQLHDDELEEAALDIVGGVGGYTTGRLNNDDLPDLSAQIDAGLVVVSTAGFVLLLMGAGPVAVAGSLLVLASRYASIGKMAFDVFDFAMKLSGFLDNGQQMGRLRNTFGQYLNELILALDQFDVLISALEAEGCLGFIEDFDFSEGELIEGRQLVQSLKLPE